MKVFKATEDLVIAVDTGTEDLYGELFTIHGGQIEVHVSDTTYYVDRLYTSDIRDYEECTLLIFYFSGEYSIENIIVPYDDIDEYLEEVYEEG